MKFEFENNEKLECVELDGEPLFNPYTIGECLEMTHEAVRKFVQRMNDNKKILLKNSDGTISPHRKFNNAGELFITESGLYNLIFRSRAKEAEKFQDWVTDEVIPSIRKTGSYNLNPETKIGSSLKGLQELGVIEPAEVARVSNESWRAKLANLINDVAKRNQTSTKLLYEKLYYSYASETGVFIPHISKEEGLTNSKYLKKNEILSMRLYQFAIAYFYKGKNVVELINWDPAQKTLGEFKV